MKVIKTKSKKLACKSMTVKTNLKAGFWNYVYVAVQMAWRGGW